MTVEEDRALVKAALARNQKRSQRWWRRRGNKRRVKEAVELYAAMRRILHQEGGRS